MPTNVHTTDPLHPARLLVSAALSPAEFYKKFRPRITSTPPLRNQFVRHRRTRPSITHDACSNSPCRCSGYYLGRGRMGCHATGLLQQSHPMPYSKRNQSSWNSWVKYTEGVPAVLECWGYYRLVRVGGAKVLLFKSNAHYAAAKEEQNLEDLVIRLLQNVEPELILSIGTAGGARTSDPIGTVNVVHSDTLYESNQPQTNWPRFTNAWLADWTLVSAKAFGKLLLPVPTTIADLKSIVAQFNQFYSTNYSLNALNTGNLNMGAPVPSINNLTGPATALVTAKSFVVGTSAGNLSKFACVEMDDAIIARTVSGKAAFRSIRNISDPVQAAALPVVFQGHWGEAISIQLTDSIPASTERGLFFGASLLPAHPRRCERSVPSALPKPTSRSPIPCAYWAAVHASKKLARTKSLQHSLVPV